MVCRSVKGPGKPYCRMPEGLTGDVGMGTGEAAEPGDGIRTDVVGEGRGRVVGVSGGDGFCFGWEE